MNTDHPKYLKKIGAPDNDYHIWTPYLAARGDMLPFDPPDNEGDPLGVSAVTQRLESLGISISQAAREIGIDKGRLSRWLNRQTETLRKENRERIWTWLRGMHVAAISMDGEAAE